jgi:tRNA(His) 5'-end guanylyltransferase
MNKDSLGDRMKGYESKGRFLPLLPIIVRVDGKCFSSFTKGLARPYDQRLIDLMVEVTKRLVSETNARIGYTQSDEINLVLYEENLLKELPFGGKKQKLISVLASTASAWFNQLRPEYIPNFKVDIPAVFDCRAFTVPTKEEATNAILWRELDATRNAISMAARARISHKQMQNKNSKELQEMLWQEHGINFNDYPEQFKRGSFIQRKLVLLEPAEMADIPAEYRPTKPIERHHIDYLPMPSFNKVVNRVEVIFDGASPQRNTTPQ